MKLDSLKDLYIEELQGLYDAEHQLFDGLTALAESAVLPDLKKTFADHLGQTRLHAERLRQILQHLGVRPAGAPSRTMLGLIAECRALIQDERKADPGVLDAALIGAAQKMEHFEMAGYGCARTYAEMLGDHEAARLLQLTLEEEDAANQRLTDLALHSVNAEAADATSDEALIANATAEAIEALAAGESRR